jgi:colanic acid/amylovoran biosynthesis glycosyltransferase
MRILMFSDGFGSLTTTFIKNEVRYFAKKQQLWYVAGSIQGEMDSLHTEEIPFTLPRWKEKLYWYLWQADLVCSFRDRRYAEKLEGLIKDISPDIIHCHFGYEGLKLLQNVKTKIPILVHFHGYDASQMLRKRSYVIALKRIFESPRIAPIVVSNKMHSALENKGIDMSRATILRYGIDLSLFKLHERKSVTETTHFVQVSSLVEKKGHEYTLRALARALELSPKLRKKISVSFTGDGPRLGHLQSLTVNLGLGDIVSWVGSKQPGEVLQLLQDADVFLHHSVTAKNGDEEGIPNAIMEAMAMELPVLSTFHSGIPELVENGVNGFLSSEKDVEVYADQIIQIVEWEKRPENRKVIEDRYNMIKHNEQLEKIYMDKLR